MRGLADTVGFAHLDYQMDEVMKRIKARDGAAPERIFREKAVSAGDRWRMAIAPHDDYAYVGSLYPLVLANIKACTVIVFGVAHKARQLGLEDQLIFDTFTHWHGPYGDIAVSPFREEIMERLPQGSSRVSDKHLASASRVTGPDGNGGSTASVPGCTSSPRWRQSPFTCRYVFGGVSFSSSTGA